MDNIQDIFILFHKIIYKHGVVRLNRNHLRLKLSSYATKHALTMFAF